MTFNLLLIITILFNHTIADFVFQTDYMARNKSSNWRALIDHIGVYTLITTVLMLWEILFIPGMSGILTMLINKNGWHFFTWIMVNAFLHFGIDAISSRLSKYFFTKGDYLNGFIIVGFDQLLHFISLFGTISLFRYLFI